MHTSRPLLRGRNILLSLAFIFAMFGLLSAAFAVTYTKQTARVVRLQCDPVYTGGATPTAVSIDFFIVQRIVNDADATDVAKGGVGDAVKITVDLLDPARASDAITAGGKTVSPPQLAALLRQYALDRATAAGIQ